jgi:hypothetical protein
LLQPLSVRHFAPAAPLHRPDLVAAPRSAEAREAAGRAANVRYRVRIATAQAARATEDEVRALRVEGYERWYEGYFGRPPLPSMAPTYQAMSGEQMLRAYQRVNARPRA